MITTPPSERFLEVHSALLDLEQWVRKLVAQPQHRKRHCKACHILGRLDRLRCSEKRISGNEKSEGGK